MSLILMSVLIAGPLAAAPVMPPVAVTQAGPRSIPVGDPLRRTLLDGLRPSIEEELNQPVQFVVDQLRVQGDWAFFAGQVQRPDGRPIDFARAGFAEQIAEGMFDGPATYGLLHGEGARWTVTVFVIGPTDVAYIGWPEAYGAPASLFD